MSQENQKNLKIKIQKPRRRPVESPKTFEESGLEVSPLREYFLKYCIAEQKMKGIETNFYTVGFWDGNIVCDTDLTTLMFEAKSDLEAIIVWKDHVNRIFKTPRPEDSYNDECFIDVVYEYNILDDSPEKGDLTREEIVKIFSSPHIDKIMNQYVTQEFENDSLWLEKLPRK